VLCDLVFIGLLLTLCYFAIGGWERQENFVSFAGIFLARPKLVVIRRKANQSFRLRLDSGLRQSGSAFGAAFCGTAEAVPLSKTGRGWRVDSSG
jgi:hypothetical protein